MLRLWSERAGQVVQMCLQTEKIPNADITAELDSVSRRTAALVPQIGSSAAADALTGDDAAFWGEAIGYLFSAAIRRCIPKRVPIGEPLDLDTGTNKFKFSVPPGQIGLKAVEEVWIDTAWENIALVSSIQTNRAGLLATSLFTAAGPTRAREAQGRYRTFNPLYNLMDDLVRTEAIFLINEAAWTLWNII